MNAATATQTRSQLGQSQHSKQLLETFQPLIDAQKSAGIRGYCYVCHFGVAIGNSDNPRGQAQHYCGHCQDLSVRWSQHQAGKGAKITQHCVKHGIPIVLGNAWFYPSLTEAILQEARLKREKHLARHCRHCRECQRVRGMQ